MYHFKFNKGYTFKEIADTVITNQYDDSQKVHPSYYIKWCFDYRPDGLYYLNLNKQNVV